MLNKVTKVWHLKNTLFLCQLTNGNYFWWHYNIDYVKMQEYDFSNLTKGHALDYLIRETTSPIRKHFLLLVQHGRSADWEHDVGGAAINNQSDFCSCNMHILMAYGCQCGGK